MNVQVPLEAGKMSFWYSGSIQPSTLSWKKCFELSRQHSYSIILSSIKVKLVSRERAAGCTKSAKSNLWHSCKLKQITVVEMFLNFWIHVADFPREHDRTGSDWASYFNHDYWMKFWQRRRRIAAKEKEEKLPFTWSGHCDVGIILASPLLYSLLAIMDDYTIS